MQLYDLLVEFIRKLHKIHLKVQRLTLRSIDKRRKRHRINTYIEHFAASKRYYGYFRGEYWAAEIFFRSL